MKFFNKQSVKEREIEISTEKKRLSREELEKKVIEGTELAIKKYRKALTKLGDA